MGLGDGDPTELPSDSRLHPARRHKRTRANETSPAAWPVGLSAARLEEWHQGKIQRHRQQPPPELQNVFEWQREGPILLSAQPSAGTILGSFFVVLYKRADWQRAVLHLSPDFSSVL